MFCYPMKSGTYQISSGFGPRWGTLHRGADFAAPVGTPIYAPAYGTIVQGKDRAPGSVSGFGSWIWLDAQQSCGKDFIFGHVHHPGITVSRGQRVKAGQQIGVVGNEGDTTGPHLHFEVWTPPGRTSGKAIDPQSWLRRVNAVEPGSPRAASSEPVKAPSKALMRWQPDTTLISPNTSGSINPKSMIWLIYHTDESAYDYQRRAFRPTGWSARRLAEYQQSPAAGGSYNAAADKDGKTARIAHDGSITWSTGNAGNSLGFNVCYAGTTAHFSRAQWLERMTQLRAGALIGAYAVTEFGIPIRKLQPGDWKARRGGIGGHDGARELGSTTHWDPGPGFPWDIQISLIKEVLSAMNPDEIRKIVREEVKAYFEHQAHPSLVPGSDKAFSLKDYVRLIDSHSWKIRTMLEEALDATANRAKDGKDGK